MDRRGSGRVGRRSRLVLKRVNNVDGSARRMVLPKPLKEYGFEGAAWAAIVNSILDSLVNRLEAHTIAKHATAKLFQAAAEDVCVRRLTA